ncbi:MAG TPA: hypothetical protein VFZ27_07955 [Terriglobia bacterium]|nr:hypothetical protein [Terriglobia bacterium]
MGLKNLLNRFKYRRNGPSTRHLGGHPEPGVEGIPDFVEPLLGWRAWRVWTPPSRDSNSCPAFSSVILDTPWTPRKRFSAEHSLDLGARCRGFLDPGCSCGIYAFKDPLEAFVYLLTVRDRLLSMAVEIALGTVSLWGKVVECELGYRAQYAYPRHLYLPASLVRYLPKVASTFGVVAGVYVSACEEEISLPVFSGPRTQQPSRLHLKNSVYLSGHGFPFDVGLYDTTASPGRKTQFPNACPDFPHPASGLPGVPGDSYRS